VSGVRLELVKIDPTQTGFDFVSAPNEMTYGDSVLLKAQGGQSGGKITYSVVSGPGTVDANGNLTATGAGTVTVKATLAGNETYDPAEATVKISVLPKKITVTAENKLKVYGSADPTLTYKVEGLVDGDTLTGTLKYTGTDAGTYDIVKDSGFENGNYDVTFVKGTMTITKKSVTVTADNQTKVYGAADPTLTYKVEGLVGTDLLTGTVKYTGTNVGIYDIVKDSGFENGNYDVTFVKGTMTITKKSVTVTADNQTKVYGAADPTLTYKVEGLVGTDLLTGTVKYTGTNVGIYDIVKDSGFENGNYDVTFVKGTMTITKKSVTVTADNQTKVYGAADPTLTYKVEGLVDGDTLTGTLKYTGSNAGTYDIVKDSGFENGNYDVTFVKGTMTITKKSVTVTADNQTKVYGASDPALTYKVEGLVGNDTLTGTLKYTGSNAGTYDIVIASGFENENYDVTFVKGTMTITKKPITVTADNQTKVYGAADPTLTYKVEGLVDGDTLTGTLKYTGSAVGSYDIVKDSGFENGNYDVTFVKGTMTITAPASTDDSQGSSSDTTDTDATGSGSVTDGGASGSAGSTGTSGGGNPPTSDGNLLLFVALISVAVLSVAVLLFGKRKIRN